MKYTRCPNNNIGNPKTFIKSKRQIMCGSNFYGSDVTYKEMENEKIISET